MDEKALKETYSKIASLFLIFLFLLFVVFDYSGMCYISLLTRMFPWDLGLLDWMWSILMIGDYVVVLLQVFYQH